jgi:hypothetical protein
MASSDVSFVLDTAAAEELLTSMAMPTVKTSAEAIVNRARSMASGMSSDPPEFSVTTEMGTIKRGVRAIATIAVQASDAHQNYIGFMALSKAKDAGNVN